MKRRAFMGGVGAMAVASGAVRAEAESAADRGLIPKRQDRPLPNLGTHWEVFKELSRRCRPGLSFLNQFIG